MADFAQNAAAAFRLVDPTLFRNFAGIDPIGDRKWASPAEERLQLSRERREASVKSDQRSSPGSSGSLDNFIQSFFTDRQRFFNQDRLSRAQSISGHARVG